MAGMWTGNQSPNNEPPKSSTTNKKSNDPKPNRSTTMCEHHETLQRAAHELEVMRGNGVIDIPKLRNILNQALEGGHHG